MRLPLVQQVFGSYPTVPFYDITKTSHATKMCTVLLSSFSMLLSLWLFLPGPVESCCLALVAKAVANDWKWLGRYLAVPETTISNIQTENESQDERSYQVLDKWRRLKGCKATVHLLMKAVQEVGDVDAMERFDRHLGEHPVEGTAVSE